MQICSSQESKEIQLGTCKNRNHKFPGQGQAMCFYSSSPRCECVESVQCGYNTKAENQTAFGWAGNTAASLPSCPHTNFYAGTRHTCYKKSQTSSIQIFLKAKVSFTRNSVFLQTEWLLQILALSRKLNFYLSHHISSLLLPLYFLVYFLMHILLLFLANIIGSSGVITLIIKGYKQAPVCKFLSLLVLVYKGP